MRSVSAGLDALKIFHWDVLYSINHSLKIKPRCHASSRTTATRLNFDCKPPGDFPVQYKARALGFHCAAVRCRGKYADRMLDHKEGYQEKDKAQIVERVPPHKSLLSSCALEQAFVDSIHKMTRAQSGSKKRKAGIDYVGVHAGITVITVTYTGVGYMMKLVAERQRSLRREKKLHA